MITFYKVFNYLMIFFENENYFKGHIIKEVFVYYNVTTALMYMSFSFKHKVCQQIFLASLMVINNK